MALPFNKSGQQYPIPRNCNSPVSQVRKSRATLIDGISVIIDVDMDSIFNSGNSDKKVINCLCPGLLIYNDYMAHCIWKNIILMMNIVVIRCIKYIGLTGNFTQVGTQSM